MIGRKISTEGTQRKLHESIGFEPLKALGCRRAFQGERVSAGKASSDGYCTNVTRVYKPSQFL